MLEQILAVRESLAQVSLSDREFRSLVALQSDNYWQLDAMARVTMLNRPLPIALGDTVGRPLPDLFEAACEADGVDQLRQALQAQTAFRGLRLRGTPSPASERFELVLNGEPRRDAQGRVFGWHGTVTDVSSEARVQAALQDKQTADLANLAKSRFLSQISHELRTPLNAVLGFSQLLLTDKGLGDKHRSQVEHIERAGHWLVTMVSDLMDLSAVEAGKLRLHMEPVNAWAVIDEAAQYLQAQATAAGVRIVREGDAARVWVQADATRLQQVLVNLISNAVNYNRPQGEVRLRVRAGLAGRTWIEVHDTGLGLSTEQRAQLFTPFNRLGREAQNIQGTGIGLVISKQIVEAMGGELLVDSVVGRGSCFTVCIDDAAAPESHRRGLDLKLPPRATQERPLVLYVEDEPVNVIIMQSIVESIPGLRFAHSTTAEEGLEMTRRQRPALLLLDINLPGQPGTWLAAQVAADAVLAATPYAAVTADATEENFRALRAAGFIECFSKPIDLGILTAWLRALVRG